MRPHKKKGFTLVELMVSIVIIVVLAGLAMMFVKRGVMAAKAAKCSSNMRQIHSGVMELSMAGIRTDFNPPGTYIPYAGHLGKPWSHFVWIDLVAEQMNLCEPVKGLYEWKVHPKTTIFQNPLSEYHLGGEGDTWKSFAKNRDVSGGSYSYNWRAAPWVAPHNGFDKEVTRMSEMTYPAMTILFGETDDERAKRGEPCWGFWGAGVAPQGNYKNSAHCAFADGHIELISNERLKDKQWFDRYTHVKPPKKKLNRPQ